jgi:hypothetical protein
MTNYPFANAPSKIARPHVTRGVTGGVLLELLVF